MDKLEIKDTIEALLMTFAKKVWKLALEEKDKRKFDIDLNLVSRFSTTYKRTNSMIDTLYQTKLDSVIKEKDEEIRQNTAMTVNQMSKKDDEKKQFIEEISKYEKHSDFLDSTGKWIDKIEVCIPGDIWQSIKSKYGVE